VFWVFLWWFWCFLDLVHMHHELEITLPNKEQQVRLLVFLATFRVVLGCFFEVFEVFEVFLR
jgi:hypothetical protein